MYDDGTAYIVLLCYNRWLYYIDYDEERYHDDIRFEVDWHAERYKEISDLLICCWSEREADDDSLILDISSELDVCRGFLEGYEERYQLCEEDYNKHVSDMEHESDRMEDICTYDYYNDTLLLEPRNVYTYF